MFIFSCRHHAGGSQRVARCVSETLGPTWTWATNPPPLQENWSSIICWREVWAHQLLLPHFLWVTDQALPPVALGLSCLSSLHPSFLTCGRFWAPQLAKRTRENPIPLMGKEAFSSQALWAPPPPQKKIAMMATAWSGWRIRIVDCSLFELYTLLCMCKLKIIYVHVCVHKVKCKWRWI